MKTCTRCGATTEQPCGVCAQCGEEPEENVLHVREETETGADEKEGKRLFLGILCGALALTLIAAAVSVWALWAQPGSDAAYVCYQTSDGDLYYVPPRSGKAILLADTKSWESVPQQIVSATGKTYAYFFKDALYVGTVGQPDRAIKAAEEVQDAFFGIEGDVLQFVDAAGAYHVFHDGKKSMIASSVVHVGNTDGRRLYYLTPRGNLYVKDALSGDGEKKIAGGVKSIEATGAGGLYYLTEKNELYYLKEGGEPVFLDAKATSLLDAAYADGKALYLDEEGNCVYAKPGMSPQRMQGDATDGYVADFEREIFYIRNGKDICRYENGEVWTLQNADSLTYSFEDGIAWYISEEGTLLACGGQGQSEPVAVDQNVAFTVEAKDSRCLYIKQGVNGESKLYLAQTGKQPQLLESGKYGFYAMLTEKGVVYAKYRDAEGDRSEIWVRRTSGEAERICSDAGGYGFWETDDLYYQDMAGKLYWYNGNESILVSEDCLRVGVAR